MKRYCSVSAACPFYHSEERQKIFCEGVEEGCSIHNSFDTPTHCTEFKERVCYTNKYDRCPIYIGLLSKYEGGDNT